jgi:serine/threonine-protein kinase
MAGATAPAFFFGLGLWLLLVVLQQAGYITPTLNTLGTVTDLRMQLQTALASSYTLERELGRGGMATVFLAQDLRHDRPVALKVLHPDLARTLGPERFQREIRLAARLQHPHILTVHDSGEAAGQLWFTMPYVEGESLRDRLRRERQLPVEAALRIATEAARALEYAHRQGVVHRDIKPENLLLTTDGSALVADFGIARALAGVDDRLTETGLVVGTPAYMSPEQAAGDKALDARTDVYSLGAVLYEMLAGEPPFTGPTAQAIIAKRLSGEVPRVRQTRPSVPEHVDAAITRALGPVAADRFNSVEEFARALVATVATSPVSATASAPSAMTEAAVPTRVAARRPTGRRVHLGAATLALGCLVAVGLLFAWRRTHGTAEDGTEPRRLAVLPFENLGDSADAYFADGVSDAVRGKLMALPTLSVIARASSEPYRRSGKSPQEIGRELGVAYLLTGTVRWAKRPDGTSRVQVSPELLEVATEAGKWQEAFDAQLTDVFQMQAEIAARVAQALDVALGAGEQRALAQQPTVSLAAYDAFLKGEAAAQSVGNGDPASLRPAVGFYEQAVAVDSAFLEAWAQLARAQALLYVNGTPTPMRAEAARHAAERAVALGPDRPEGQLALGEYYADVRADFARAEAAYAAGLAVAPEHPGLLVGAALAEESLGRWEAALAHLERAQALDPRSVSVARRLARALLWLRRYPAALQASDRGRALAPTNLDLLQIKAMVYLAQGDLPGARAVLRAAPAEVTPTALVALFGNYWDLFWVLDDAQQQLLLRLPPSAFDDDRATWGLVLAQTWQLRGDTARARAYADSARVGYDEQLAATPGSAQRHILRGLALAYQGRKAEAITAGERTVALAPITRDAYNGAYYRHQLARIYLLAGEPEKALDQLEPLLKIPYYLSPAWLRIDPTFAPLRGNPRFERLVAGR